jgi:uncharacterized protein (TIGR00369 family)
MSELAPSTERRRVVTWHDPKASARLGAQMAGLDYLRAMMAGDLPPPPAIELLGITMLSAEPGIVRMGMPVGEYLYNPIGTVHGGTIATLLDSVLGCAVHSMLPAGRGYTTLEIKVNYLRAVTEATAEIVAEGRTVHVGRQSAVAEGRVTDESGRIYATASTTCLVFDHRPRASE